MTSGLSNDIYHGIEVEDPYRWLEEKDSQVDAWVTDQSLACAAYFERPDIAGQLRDMEHRIRPLLSLPKVEGPILLRDGVCFYLYREAGEQQGCIVSQAGPNAARKILVRPHGRPEGDYVSLLLLDVSEGCKWLAYGVRVGGSQQYSVEILILETGEVHNWKLPEGQLMSLKFEGKYGVRYIHETPHAKRPNLRQEEHQRLLDDFPEHHQVYYIAGESKNLRFVTIFSPDQMLGIYRIFQVGASKQEKILLLNHHECGGPMSLIVDGFESKISFQLLTKAVYFCTDCNAPNKRVCRLDLENPLIETAAVVVPECANTIEWWLLCNDAIFVTYSRGLVHVTEIWSLEGGILRTVDYGTEGSVDPLGVDVDGNRIFVSFENHTTSPKVLEVRSDGSCRPFNTESDGSHKPGFSVITLSLHAVADDATEVPYTVLANEDVLQNTEAPVVVTGYGGYGLGLTPRFSAFIHAWTQAGGIFAIPNLRGGNEFGRTWHVAAQGAGRERAFADLRSVLDDMTGRGYAAPHRIGLAGGSNAGILVCYAMTRWSERISAVVCLVPITDLIRFSQQNPQYADEFGSVDDPDDFQYLHRLSPYHRALRAGNYPALLMISGAKDEVCDPYHAFKFVAALQGSNNSSRPLLLDFEAMRGHSASLPLEHRIQALARRIVFLRHELTAASSLSDRDQAWVHGDTLDDAEHRFS
jgi:prolyl oligopeptidase